MNQKWGLNQRSENRNLPGKCHDSSGDFVDSTVIRCGADMLSQVLRVISNACTDKCLYTLDIYRGGPNNFAKWFQKNVPWRAS
jgi:hypothetical protein